MLFNLPLRGLNKIFLVPIISNEASIKAKYSPSEIANTDIERTSRFNSLILMAGWKCNSQRSTQV